MSRLRLVKSEICQEVQRVEVLSVEADDGTWLFDKIKLHTRKGIITATCDTQVLPQLKTHNNPGTQDD
jgi:hypothetical protein